MSERHYLVILSHSFSHVLHFSFSEKSVPGSINIPYDSIDLDKNIREGISSSPELSVLMNNRGNMIVVIGHTILEGAKVSMRFLRFLCYRMPSNEISFFR